MRSKIFLMMLFPFLWANGFCFEPSALVEHVGQSIEKANKGESKLNEAVLGVRGYSNSSIRHFLNNLCSLPGINYLEIGVWEGSTFFSAIHRNHEMKSATAIDNWSRLNPTCLMEPSSEKTFYSSFRLFEENFPKNISVIKKDCFKVSAEELEVPVHIYFYDGFHEAEYQYRAFSEFDNVLDRVFIALVDDWNWVEKPTREVFEDLGYIVHQEWVRPWWNGFYIAVVEKTR